MQQGRSDTHVRARPRADRLPSFRRRTRRLRTLLAGGLLLAVVAPMMAFVLASSSAAEQESVALAEEIGSRVAQRTADNVDQFLQPARQSVRSVASITADPVTRSSTDALERILISQLAAAPSVNGLYVAFPDGSFRFVRRTEDGMTLKRIDTEPSRRVSNLDVAPPSNFGAAVVDDSDSYDPRSRGWYAAAVEADDLVWANAYVFFSSKQPGVTAAQAVRSGGEVVAVVGADIELAGLSSFLSELPLDDSTEAFIVTESGEVVGAPPGYSIGTPDEDGNVELVRAEEFDLVAGGEPDGFVSSSVLRSAASPNWTVTVRSESIDFVDVVGSQRWWVRVLVATTSLVTIVLVGLLGLRLTRPLVDLERRANTDPLTGLANRAALFEEGGSRIQRCRDDGVDLAVAVCDIDDFKSINDELGHLGGDEVLRVVADTLVSRVHADDFVARLGGDEFVVIMAARGGVNAADMLADLRSTVADAIAGSVLEADAGFTVGATMLDGRDIALEDLLREADAALGHAKRIGKGVVAWAPVSESA